MIPQEWLDALTAAIDLWRDVDAEEIYGPAYCELQEIRSYLQDVMDEEEETDVHQNTCNM